MAEPAVTAHPDASLAGRVAIVTGGGRGLGRTMALALAGAGARVIVTAARERAEIDAVATQSGAAQSGAAQSGAAAVLPVLADVTSAEDCARVAGTAMQRFGRVDILVNNAGRGMRYVSERFLTEPTRFWETDPAVWRMVIDTNVNGPFLMARAVVPSMLPAGWGRVINVSMNHATMRRAGFSPYGPSKAALDAETAIWAQDLQGTGVTVNAVLPGGATLTGMIPDSADAALRAKLLAPSVIVPPVLWLASPASDGVSGMRLDASRWRGDLDPAEAAAVCSEAL